MSQPSVPALMQSYPDRPSPGCYPTVYGYMAAVIVSPEATINTMRPVNLFVVTPAQGVNLNGDIPRYVCMDMAGQ